MRRGARTVIGVVAFLAVGLVVAPAQAAGVILYRFTGIVADPLSRPLANADVSDGSQHVSTDVNGRYSLPETTTGTWVLRACRTWSTCASTQISVLTPQDTTVNFTLPYLLTGTASRWAVSTASGPATSLLTLKSGVDAAGTCLNVTDSRTGGTSTANFVKTNPDGSTEWSWTLSVPQGSAEGWQTLSVQALQCASGKSLSNQAAVNYLIDNSAPAIGSKFPVTWATAAPLVGVTVTDGNGSGFDLVDGVALSGCTFSGGVFDGQARGLSEGIHHASVTAVDEAGNVAIASFSFSVDSTAPSLSNPAPTGTISNRSPLIRVTTSDAGSGVAPSTIDVSISNGIMSSNVPASYDASTGEISYQVPQTIAGGRLGQFPLVDGSYRVTVRVSDCVGNSSITSWTFTVKTLPV